jgi:hypothetical protein
MFIITRELVKRPRGGRDSTSYPRPRTAEVRGSNPLRSTKFNIDRVTTASEAESHHVPRGATQRVVCPVTSAT